MWASMQACGGSTVLATPTNINSVIMGRCQIGPESDAQGRCQMGPEPDEPKFSVQLSCARARLALHQDTSRMVLYEMTSR